MTGVCDAGNAPRPTQTLLSFPPVSPLSFPPVVSGNPVSFLLPPKSPHAQPCSLLPWLPAIPLDSRFRGNDRRVRHGQRPTTNPNMAGPQLPAIPLDSRSPITHVGDRLRGNDSLVRRGQPPRPTPFCHSRRPPPVIPASPLLSFPPVVSGNPVSFLLPRSRHPPNPVPPGPQLPAIPLDSCSPITNVGDRLRGHDRSVRRGQPPRPTQTLLSFPPVSPLSFPQVVSGNPRSFLLPQSRHPPNPAPPWPPTPCHSPGFPLPDNTCRGQASRE